jgi:molybdopterin converting factor small subunit
MADMAEDKSVVPVPTGDVPHDRVVGLSLRSDGTPDQNNPEIIGDKDAAVEVTKKQFAEFAVSAVDQAKRQELGLASSDEGDTSDALIDKLKAEHDKVAAAAEKKAESLVNSLHKG